MQVARNYPRCGVCGAKLVRNGTTSAGRVRWRCKACGASCVRSRVDVTRRAQLAWFVDWLLGTASQRSRGGGTGRSFRASTRWCWNIEVPQPTLTGEVLPTVMLDGTYFQGWCLLIAFSGSHVLGWQWCNRESKAAWSALLERLPAPEMVVVDGGRGIAAALATHWPKTRVQRCYFHIFNTVTRHLTMRPRLDAGKQLRALVKALMQVSNLEQARAWIVAYANWETHWDEFLKHRSYPSEHKERPRGIGAPTVVVHPPRATQMPQPVAWAAHPRGTVRLAHHRPEPSPSADLITAGRRPEQGHQRPPASPSRLTRSPRPTRDRMAPQLLDRIPSRALESRSPRALDTHETSPNHHRRTRQPTTWHRVLLGRRNRHPERLGRPLEAMTRREPYTHFCR